MKRVLLAGFIGSKNLGDEAIFESLIALLGSLPIHVAAITLNETKTRALTSETVPRGNLGAVLKAIKRSDYVILGGGGLLQDETSIFNLPGHLWPLWAARFYRKPFVLMAVGVGPLKRTMSRRLVQSICKSAILITVRDRESGQMLAELGVDPQRVHVVSDPAVSLPLKSAGPESYPDFRRIEIPLTEISKRDYMVVCLRDLSYTTCPWLPVRLKNRINKIFPARETDELWTEMAHALDAIIERYRFNVLFVPFYEKRDDDVHHSVIHHMRRKDSAQNWDGPMTPRIFCALAAQSRLVLSMRLHGCVLSARVNAPVLGLSYSPKVRSFFKSLDLEGCCLDIGEIKSDRLSRAVEELRAREKEIKERMSLKVAELNQLNLKNIDLLAEELGR